MSIRVMWGLVALWVMATVICSISEGVYTGEGIKDTINGLTGFHYLKSQGILGIPLMGATFFTHLPKLLAFNYSFFEGTAGWQILRFLMMSISVGVIFGLFMAFANLLMGVASRFFGSS